jgi:hypothetical protein
MVLGLVVYAASMAMEQKFKSESTLVQLVQGENVVSEPFLAIVPVEVCFVKGSGKQGSKFVKTEDKVTPTKSLLQIASLAKIGGILMTIFGGVGMMFERWRMKTGAILRGEVD